MEGHRSTEKRTSHGTGHVMVQYAWEWKVVERKRNGPNGSPCKQDYVQSSPSVTPFSQHLLLSPRMPKDLSEHQSSSISPLVTVGPVTTPHLQSLPPARAATAEEVEEVTSLL